MIYSNVQVGFQPGIYFSLLLSLGFNIFSLESLEASYFNKLCNSVQLFFSIFVFVSLSTKTNSYTRRDVSDTSAPDVFVQLRVNSYILSSHCFSCKLLDFLNGTRCLSLKGNLVSTLGEVDSVITRYEIWFLCSWCVLCHLEMLLIVNYCVQHKIIVTIGFVPVSSLSITWYRKQNVLLVFLFLDVYHASNARNWMSWLFEREGQVVEGS